MTRSYAHKACRFASACWLMMAESPCFVRSETRPLECATEEAEYLRLR